MTTLIETWTIEDSEFAEMDKMAKNLGYSDLKDYLIKRGQEIKEEISRKSIKESLK